MAKITFNTGRGYSKEGQIITAKEIGTPYDDFDFFSPGFDDSNDPGIEFEDHTRGIKGRIMYCHLREDDIMRRYDTGEYTNI